MSLVYRWVSSIYGCYAVVSKEQLLDKVLPLRTCQNGQDIFSVTGNNFILQSQISRLSIVLFNSV